MRSQSGLYFSCARASRQDICRRATHCASLMLLWVMIVTTGGRAQTVTTGPAARLSTLQRTLKHFDFEDAERFHTTFPENFYRYDASAQGFPPFGVMRLTDETSSGGRWSLVFELSGGSMSARVPTGVLPVLPFADYVVSARVKTADLANAKARLVAWLHDTSGTPINESRAESRLIQTNGSWDTLSVEVHGEYAEAAHLVLELQLLQPRQFERPSDLADMPRLDDVAGRVWFDDVIVSHLPRLSISMGPSGHIITLPDQPGMNVSVRELSSDALTALLRVYDLDGQCVHESSFPAPRGRHSDHVSIPLTTCGWYRAVLDITMGKQLVRRRWTDFVLVGPETASRAGRGNSTGLAVLIDTPPGMIINQTRDLITSLEVDTAVVPAWDSTITIKNAEQRLSPLKQLIEQLILRRVGLIMTIDVVPDELVRTLNLRSGQALEMMASDARAWRPYLDHLLVSFGLEINRWQVGSRRGVDSASNQNLAAAVSAAARSLGDFVPQPSIFVPWPLDRETPEELTSHSYTITVPRQCPPDSLAEYVAPWVQGADGVLLVLDQLPPSDYTPRRRAVDVMLRALHAWRAGAAHIAIDGPWVTDGTDSGHAVPTPIFVVWRSLAMHLRGRRFIAELPAGDGVTCWILQGASASDAVLVAWGAGESASRPAVLRSQLSNRPVVVIDAFGNRTQVEPHGGFHEIPLGEMPVFIEGVNRELVQFRGEFAIEPTFIPAVASVHEARLILHNPWSVAVSGTVRVSSDAEWLLSPAVQDFTISPGGETRLSMTIIPERNIIAGLKSLTADVTLNADQTYAIRMQTEVEIGLRNIDLVTTWNIVRNVQTGQDDLMINNMVTNRGQQPINLDVFMLAEGVSQNRRTIARLYPGESAVRVFRIANGAAILGGKQVRVGVAERDGTTRLNRILDITANRAVVSAE